ncbi:MAG: hypothetical protein FWC78_07310 [Defluviitaleaceae bacterium]|nr:hypothetical protein [Defluviitaleaceae bacterium]
MSKFTDVTKKVGSAILNETVNAFKDAEKNYSDEEYYKGYDKATRYCMDVISERIDELRCKILEGKNLPKEEHFLKANLEEIRNELEKILLRGRRNIRPIVKGAVRVRRSDSE